MKTEVRVLTAGLAICFATVCFFLSAFYGKVDEALVEVTKINTTLAVAVTNMSILDRKVTRLENEDKSIKQDVKKLNDGFINLKTRVGYLESH